MGERKYKPITDDIMQRVMNGVNDVPKRNPSKFTIVHGEYDEGDYVGKLIVESIYGRSAFRRYFTRSGVEGLHFECAYLAHDIGCEWHIEFTMLETEGN